MHQFENCAQSEASFFYENMNTTQGKENLPTLLHADSLERIDSKPFKTNPNSNTKPTHGRTLSANIPYISQGNFTHTNIRNLDNYSTSSSSKQVSQNINLDYKRSCISTQNKQARTGHESWVDGIDEEDEGENIKEGEDESEGCLNDFFGDKQPLFTKLDDESTPQRTTDFSGKDNIVSKGHQFYFNEQDDSPRCNEKM